MIKKEKGKGREKKMRERKRQRIITKRLRSEYREKNKNDRQSKKT